MNARIERESDDGTATLTFPHLGVALLMTPDATYLRNSHTGETKLITHVGQELRWIAFLEQTWQDEWKHLLSDVSAAVKE